MGDDVTKDYSEDELEELEDKLLEKDFEQHKEKMPVDGRSVFEIERLKNQKSQMDSESD